MLCYVIKLDLLCLFVFNHHDNITLTLYIIKKPYEVLWQTVKMPHSDNLTEDKIIYRLAIDITI